MTGRKSDKEQDGNAMASSAAFTREVLSLGELVLRIDGIVERMDSADLFVRGIRIVTPNLDRGDWMLVISAETPSGAVVAFHSGGTLFEALKGALLRMENGSLKWKDDQYRK